MKIRFGALGPRIRREFWPRRQPQLSKRPPIQSASDLRFHSQKTQNPRSLNQTPGAYYNLCNQINLEQIGNTETAGLKDMARVGVYNLTIF